MKDGYRELVGPKEFKKAERRILDQGLVARKSIAAKNREATIGLIKATMEGIKQIFLNEKQTKAVLAKYTRQTDPEILDQTYKFAVDIFIKDPTVTAKLDPTDRSAVGTVQPCRGEACRRSTPISAYYDNSYVDDIKRSGWLAELWR